MKLVGFLLLLAGCFLVLAALETYIAIGFSWEGFAGPRT